MSGVRVLKVDLGRNEEKARVTFYLPVTELGEFSPEPFETEPWPLACSGVWDGKEQFGILDWDEEDRRIRITWKDDDQTAFKLRIGQQLSRGDQLMLTSLTRKRPYVFEIVGLEPFGY